MAQQIQTQQLALASPDIVQLLYHEAWLLNMRRFEDWLDIYTEDASTWVPIRHDQKPEDLQVSMVSDNRYYMEYRVRRLRHPAIHSQLPPEQAARLLSNIVVEEDAGREEGKETIVRSSFIMVGSRLGNHRFFGGYYRHFLRWTDGAWKIARKEVYLTNADDMHTNLNLPF